MQGAQKGTPRNSHIHTEVFSHVHASETTIIEIQDDKFGRPLKHFIFPPERVLSESLQGHPGKGYT